MCGECVCRPLLVVVDMPGYGFAFANDEKQEAWHKLVSEHGCRRRGRERVGDWKAQRGALLVACSLRAGGSRALPACLSCDVVRCCTT